MSPNPCAKRTACDKPSPLLPPTNPPKEAGFHLQHTRLMRKMINSCVPCQRLRGPLLQQRMADLPPDRTDAVTPFDASGLDVFGPFHVHHRRATRGNTGTKKCWALLCTCMTYWAVHIEPLQDMDTSPVYNALDRFFNMRGRASLLRSDRETNFVGAQRHARPFRF